MCVNILIFTWTKWDESWHIWGAGGGLIIGCMFCLQVEGPIVGAGEGEGAVADPDLQVRGGDGHSVPEKKGMEPFEKKNFRPQFGLKLRRGGGGARAPPLDPPLRECYNRQFTVANRSPTIANNIRGRGRLS